MFSIVFTQLFFSTLGTSRLSVFLCSIPHWCWYSNTALLLTHLIFLMFRAMFHHLKHEQYEFEALCLQYGNSISPFRHLSDHWATTPSNYIIDCCNVCIQEACYRVCGESIPWSSISFLAHWTEPKSEEHPLHIIFDGQGQAFCSWHMTSMHISLILLTSIADSLSLHSIEIVTTVAFRNLLSIPAAIARIS